MTSRRTGQRPNAGGVVGLRSLAATAAFCVFGSMLARDASARLGETRPECDVRYGAPVEVKGSRNFGEASIVAYKKDRIRVTVTFIAGRAEGVQYKTPEPFSLEEIEQLLELNRQGFTWQREGKTPTLPLGEWVRSDGGNAEYSRLSADAGHKFVLHVRSGELVRLAELLPAKRRKEDRLQGF